MTSDGTPWPPPVHALDTARAISCTLRADRETVHAQVLDVGADEKIYTVRDIAEAVGRVFPYCDVSFGPADADQRSYRVACAKIGQVLPDFTAQWDVTAGAKQLHRV